jgi:glycosyltransferase involved in cell wall biosynthesis
MRACMVSYSFYESDNRVRRYAETLVKLGYSVDAVALRRGELPEQEWISGVRLFRIQGRAKDEKGKLDYFGKMLAFFARSSFFLAREQWKQRYDLIHVHSLPDFEVFAALYPKLTGSKIILDIHDIVPEFYASKFNASPKSLAFRMLCRVEQMSAAFSDHVIASNHIWEKRLEGRSVAASKVTTILNYPDTGIFQTRGRTRSDDKFIILYPGSLNYHQGLDVAIRAFSLIRDKVPNAEFHIFGTGGEFASLKLLIAELGLQGRILLKGALPIDEMARVIENADLGVVPKRKDGFGNEAFSTKILEFMALNVPMIIPDTEVDTYYFDDTVAKFFCAGDESSLADAMLLMIHNRELRETLARNATKFVEGYSWDVNQGKYLGLVDALMLSANGHKSRK